MESSSHPPPPHPDSAGLSLLRHLPPEAGVAYLQMLDTGDETAADLVVLAVVREHIPDKELRVSTFLGDSLSLAADLGFDSMAIAETVFFLEDLFRVTISNAEVVRIRTIGDLRAFVRIKLAASGAAPASRA